MVPFIGLTGGIGSGKSTALEALERLGAAVLSTDKVVHELYDTAEVRDAVVARFGPDVAPGGTVDRTAVARSAFSTSENREWLEGMLWPRVGQRMVDWREAVNRQQPPPPAAVIEVPLLFESGMDRAFDATIAVIAEEEVRAKRAGGRGHHAVDERSARQLPQQEKALRATYTVVNNGSLEQLEARLSDILVILKA